MSATVSFISRLLPSYERLSLKPVSLVYRNLTVKKYEQTKKIPIMKLGFIKRSEKKDEKMNDNI